jgi:glycerol-3-phosphate acyltransferase PlsX
MGGDSKPEELLFGVRNFLKKHKDAEIILSGNEELIKPCLSSLDNFVIENAPDVIHTGDSVHTILKGTNSSMYRGLKLVEEGKADGMLTAGSTQAYVMLSYHLLKTIKGINKPAFMSYVPTSNGRGMMFLDVGANLNCTGEDLVQFAHMANIYSKEVRKIASPIVNVLNIGTEDNKGFAFHQDAHKMLKERTDINYQGFIESREMILGGTDVVVSDGYTGNIALKALEGCLMSINNLMKREYKKPQNILGAIFSLGVIKKIKKTFDYKKYAGAFVIGLNKNVCKTHGNAKREEIESALSMLYDAVSCNLTEKISNNING